MAAKSVHVEYVSAGSYMAIDAGSVQSLELLRPLQPGAATGAAVKKASSLFGCASSEGAGVWASARRYGGQALNALELAFPLQPGKAAGAAVKNARGLFEWGLNRGFRV